MSVRDFKSFPRVPIIGEPTVVEWRPLVVVKCSCGGDPILITSIDRAPTCKGCGRLYALAELHFKTDGAGGAAVADIGIMEVHPPTAPAGSNGHVSTM